MKGNIVEEGSPVIDPNSTIEIYSVNTAALPGSMYINDFSQYTDVTSAFSGEFSSFADDQVTLGFGSIETPFIIRVVSKYDPNTDNRIIPGASMSNTAAANIVHTVETSNTINTVSTDNIGTGINKYKIGDKVWNDINHDGIQNETDTGIPNVLVTLTFEDGTQKSVRTDEMGMYEFSNLPDKESYTITFETPAGFIPTTDGTDINNGLDSNPQTTTVTLNGEYNVTIDKGYIDTNSLHSLGDFTWFDINNNGIQDD